MTTETTTAVAETVESTGNQIIEVLEYLGSKMGIAIDWTSENVWPYIENVTERLVQYNIILKSISLAFFLILFIGCTIGYIKFSKQFFDMKLEKKTNSTIYFDVKYEKKEYSLTYVGYAATILYPTIILVSIISICYLITNLIQWIVIPEMPLVETIADLINKF